MISRRTFLGAASAAAAAVPVLGAAPALAGRRRPVVPLPLTVVNDTGEFANTAISLYIVGVDPTGRQCRVTPDGRRLPVSSADNGPDGYADYAIPLDPGGSTEIPLPAMSGRIYFALDGELRFRVVEGGNGQPALQYPAGWVPTDPSNTVLHDTFEFTLNDTGMYCNTTMVDMFSVPSSIRLRGARDQVTGTLESGGRQRIFSGVIDTAGFENLAQGDLRVVAPGHALDLGRFSETYFDDYIDQVWDTYSTTDMRVDINTGTTYGGRVSEGRLVFDGGVGAFDRPTTRDVLFCDGALAAGPAPRGPVAAILGAGFNRSVLHNITDQPATDAGRFYRNPITNHYARAMHANTVDGKAYGFAFDDVAGHASYVQDSSPSSITLTLTPW